ncbi:hypothetical protein Salmuc_01681 [Salipiger mucosus DSM 16094]|uniref:Lipoprotein n=2 Tax=Salipiger mucosus TaxID=263378 RepID=S9QR65_9RHOB|nr:hypothetical protein Salmuc_01681 [Salipiger mucosus DSM 16094]
MKRIVFLALVGLGVAACQATPENMGSQTMETATVVDTFIGKRLVTENGGVFLFNPDGTVGGSLRGEEIVGTYTADTQEVCSTYSAPEFLTGREFCSVPVISDNTVVFERRDGSSSPVYMIEG